MLLMAPVIFFGVAKMSQLDVTFNNISQIGHIMKFPAIAAVILMAFTTACTPRASSIPAISMTGAFDHMTCLKAKTMLDSERVQLASLERKQNSAATADAIGVFLVLVPVSKLTGGDNAGELGAKKGTVLALEQRVARCG